MDLVLAQPCQSPEVDTIRIFWLCGHQFDFSGFFLASSTKYVMSVQRSLNGEITSSWEKYRSDMRCSWWGKMQVTQEFFEGEPCVSFEFSVAKWWGVTNAVNTLRGIQYREIFEPIGQVLESLRINALWWGSEPAFEHLLKNCVLRRVDLSINFKIPAPFVTADYLKFLACVRLNGKMGKKFVNPSKLQGDWESLSFGSANTAYFVKFYDKYLEQKNYFSKRDIDNNAEFSALKKIFWRNNGEQFKNILRFEVEFRSKFFLERKHTNLGIKDMAELIDICAMRWRELLSQFEDALCKKNLECSERPLDQILADFERLLSNGKISQSCYNSSTVFLIRIYKFGLDHVREGMSRQAFYHKRKVILDLLNFDVNMLCPIMRIMQPSELVRSSFESMPMRFEVAPRVPLIYVDAV